MSKPTRARAPREAIAQVDPLKPSNEEIVRMLRYQTVPDGGRFTVGGVVGRRACEIGTVVGILALKHAIGYEVVLRFDDGKTNTFEPHQLFPAR